ncbi:ATPase [Loktanella sp. IMCC34160]|uniref:ATP12 family chaperone protein n=1 Tax=Loktanella sp. IMCC34160 TaxID=2510646 RepID=UPI00101BBA3E|nr:ATP12 family protein [Loktanella sp. IMCC34160]RYG92591.1 ATPase [Loktanella sp. IMCC34160]
MSNWKPKRFWKDATVAEADGGWQVLLDGRQVRTPAKAVLIVPTKAYAEAVAAEWDGQQDLVDPTTMPVTRSANAAIDKLSIQREEVIDMLAAYGETDLLCYRATGPQELVTRQAEQWDPVLAWANARFGTALRPVAGVMFAEQPAENLSRIRDELASFDSFSLAAAHDLIALSGSLVLAFAVTSGHLDAAAAWQLSRLDETWQAEQWGVDDEAAEAAAIKEQAFLTAADIFTLCARRA